MTEDHNAAMSDKEATNPLKRTPRWAAARIIHAFLGKTPDALLAELPVRPHAYWEIGAERVNGGARLNITKVPQYSPMFHGMTIYENLSSTVEAAHKLKNTIMMNGASAGISIISLRDSFGEPTYPSYFVGRPA